MPGDLWEWAKNLGSGAAGLLFFFWWLERQERKELQVRNELLIDRLAKVATDAVVEVRSLRELLTFGKREPPS